MRYDDFRHHYFPFIIALTAIIWLIIPQKNVFPHALPGTYSYITVYPHHLEYRLIISGVDMCRLTGWNCDDLTPEDLPRLFQIQDSLKEKLTQGIRISQEGIIVVGLLFLIHGPFGSLSPL